MQYTYEPAEKSQVKLSVKLDAADWDEAIHSAYEKNKAKFNVQGFRKGHVPFNVLVGLYGKGFFYEDAINIAINKYYPEILEKEGKNINVVGDPKFSLDDIKDDGADISALIPVMPEVKIGKYKGIKVEKTEYNVTDAELEKDLNDLAEKNSKEEPVEGRAAENGDIVVIDYSGSIDGVKFDGGTATEQRLGLGTGTFIPGFEDGVVGMNIGDERDINVKFPDDYGAENLKGKPAVFHVVLHKILKKVVPEITDEFIKDATGEENVQAYKDKQRERKQKEYDEKARNENEDKLLTAIAETTEVIIPDAMIDDEVDNMVKQFGYRLMYSGMKLEDYLKYTNSTEEKLRDSYRPTATDRVKKQLIVNTIIETENMTATEEEISAKVAEQAASVNKDAEEYRKGMDERQLKYIENSIIIEKLFAFLTENNEFIKAKKAKEKK